MARRIESPWIAGPAGRLEALLEEPDGRSPRLAAVVCHPHPLYGGTMHNKVVYRMARGLRRAGAAVLRFNFRGVGRSEGEYAHLEGEIEDARAALAWLRSAIPTCPSRWPVSLSARAPSRAWDARSGGARGCWPPVSPPASRSRNIWKPAATPKVFIQSTHDQYGPRAGAGSAVRAIRGTQAADLGGAADHFFAGGLEELEERVSETAAEAMG